MKYFYSLILLILIFLTAVVPVCLVIGGYVLSDLSWTSRIGMIAGGLLLLWMIRPFSIISGKDLKVF